MLLVGLHFSLYRVQDPSGDFLTRLLKAVPEFLLFPASRPPGRIGYYIGVSLVQAALDKMAAPPAVDSDDEDDREHAPAPGAKKRVIGGALSDIQIVPRSLSGKVHPAVLSVFAANESDFGKPSNWGFVLDRCVQVRDSGLARAAIRSEHVRLRSFSDRQDAHES
jgi:hypothetical protein